MRLLDTSIIPEARCRRVLAHLFSLTAFNELEVEPGRLDAHRYLGGYDVSGSSSLLNNQAISPLFRTPSLAYAPRRWCRTVVGEIPIRLAISL